MEPVVTRPAKNHRQTVDAPLGEDRSPRARGWVFWGGLFAGICLGVLGAFSVLLKARTAPVAIPAMNSADATGPEIEKRVGPWGEIQLTDIQVERPEGFIANLRVPAD
jgi:hypothetical protein